MELSPREVRPPERRRRAVTWVVVAALAVALAFVVWQGLDNATRYFYNADEAVARREQLGERRFRLQGTVLDGTVRRAGDEVRFEVRYSCVDVAVRHVGDPPELFRAGNAVVLEGSWAASGEIFESDTIFVKHSNEYRAEDEYDDRIRAAETGACEPGAEASP